VTEGKLTKEELRDDPVVDALMRSATVVRERATVLAIAAGIVIVAIVAFQLVRQSSAKAERDAAVVLLQGEGQYLNGNTPEALRRFQEAADKFKGAPSGKVAALRAADCQLEMGQSQEAKRLYETFLGSGVKDGLLRASAIRGIARVLESTGQPDEAAGRYLEAAEIEGSPMRADDLISAAQIYRDSGKLPDAKAAYEKVLQLFPGSPRARDARDGLEIVKLRAGS
jgi:tetratricopeptide (TPR) repeat protein